MLAISAWCASPDGVAVAVAAVCTGDCTVTVTGCEVDEPQPAKVVTRIKTAPRAALVPLIRRPILTPFEPSGFSCR